MLIKNILMLSVLFGVSLTIQGADEPVWPLWTCNVPGALGDQPQDTPTLTAFFPTKEKATGAAMVILPGGGYGHLAAHEGKGYAQWLSDLGIASFVLQYRLGSHGYRHPVMLGDASRAVRMVRSKAKELGLDPDRIGIIGSSAGGHLASTLLTHFDEGNPTASDPIDHLSSRPNLGILCYPVISMGEFTHKGSQRNLLGENPTPELLENLSNEKQIKSNTPPCFLWHTYEDTAVPLENSLLFAQGLRQAGIAFDLHIYAKGRHGLGLGSREYDPALFHPWVADCAFWLKQQGFSR